MHWQARHSHSPRRAACGLCATRGSPPLPPVALPAPPLPKCCPSRQNMHWSVLWGRPRARRSRPGTPWAARSTSAPARWASAPAQRAAGLTAARMRRCTSGTASKLPLATPWPPDSPQGDCLRISTRNSSASVMMRCDKKLSPYWPFLHHHSHTLMTAAVLQHSSVKRKVLSFK